MASADITLSAADPALIPGSPPIVTVAPGEPSGWLKRHTAAVRALVDMHGALLLRGLQLREHRDFADAAGTLLTTTIPEYECFAPREILGPNLYSGTKWPADQPMCMHHELSYARRVPNILVFGCVRAPNIGGETALADAQDVFDALPKNITEPFTRHGWLLARNYNGVIGVDWRESFRTDDPGQVERYCRENEITCDWGPGGTLHTLQRAPAVITHPRTGRRCWFNQIAFLNEWTLEPAVREYLVSEFGAERGLPFNTFLGDGTALNETTIQHINDVYDAHTVRTPWQDGDLLVVDNLRTAHSRLPYRGDRDIVAVFGEVTSPVGSG